jgi:ferritin-like metal-binding protein YciE
MDTLTELLEDELKDIYNAESQLLKALPKMAQKATSAALKAALTTHLKETEGHVQRLEKIGQSLDMRLTGKKCHAMEGLIEEGKEIIEGGPRYRRRPDWSSQTVEHYEMAAYGTVRAIAAELGHEDVAALLQQTLNEEDAADKKLTAIAEGEVLSAANEAAADEDEEE